MLTNKQVRKLKSCIKKNEMPIIPPNELYYLLAWNKDNRYYWAMAEYTKAEVKQLKENELRLRNFLRIARELGFLDHMYKKTKLWNKLFTNKLVDRR